MKILHIDTGVTGDASASRQITAAVVKGLRAVAPTAEVTHRDLDAQPVSHLDSANVGTVRPDLARDAIAADQAALSAAVLEEFLAADVVVIGAPLYNFAIPSQLKAWIDRVVVGGKTFSYSAEGPKGLAGAKTVIVASARGGVYSAGSPMASLDFAEPYLRAVFGFVGIEDLTFVRAEGLAYGPEQRAAALAGALEAARNIGSRVTRLAA